MNICYLCGLPILPGEPTSDDHVVPRVLLDHAPPKVRGFEFAGYLNTHVECNTGFFPENYVSDAITLLSILRDPALVHRFQHPDDPSLSMMAIDQTKMAALSQRSLAFFGLANAPVGIGTPAVVRSGVKIDLMGRALQTIFAVLAKSAAARILVKFGTTVPPRWRIRAVPWDFDADDASSLRSQFQSDRPVGKETGVNVDQRDGYFEVSYFQKNMVVYFLFDGRHALPDEAFLASVDPGNDVWALDEPNLLALKDAPWKRLANPVPVVSRNAPCPCGRPLRYKECHGAIER